MPRKPKDLGSYSPMFFEIAKLAHERVAIQPVAMADRKLAVSTAHHFNRFKTALARERHPHFEAAEDLVVRITNQGRAGLPGQYYLEFVPRGLAILADEMRGTRRGMDSPLRDELPGIDQLLKQAEQERAAQEEDKSEAFFKNYVGSKPKDET